MNAPMKGTALPRFPIPLGERGSRLRSFATKSSGFTLLEMMITLAIFILLAAAVFGLLTGVLESTGSLIDNQNRMDRTVAFNAYLKKKLGEMPVGSTLVSYQRGDGEGLVQNGIVFGTVNLATVVDAMVQPNGYYTLRVATYAAGTVSGQQFDARQILVQDASTNDPSLTWTPLITDVKTIDWKFLDFNQTVWVNLWSTGTLPNLLEFTMQTAGDMQPSTMDFWLPKIDRVPLNAPGGTSGGTGGGTTPRVNVVPQGNTTPQGIRH